jgi:hypothetical protein
MLRFVRILSDLLRHAVQAWSNRYRPEKHYMRGPGPASKG